MRLQLRRLARQLVLLWSTCALVLYFGSGIYSRQETPLGHNALLLTSHPDDECMFFGPTVLALPNMSALCLSTGNADGLGRLRANELLLSYQALGVPPGRVAYLDDPCVFANSALQDGMKTQWDPGYIAARVANHICASTIDTVRGS